MSEPEARTESGGPPAHTRDAGSRIAANSVLRGVGEIVGKLASVVFYIAIARKLGDDQFGDFIFGLSISTVLLSLAGLGTSELIIREIARDHRAVDRYFSDTITFKVLFTILLLSFLAVYLAIAGYPLDTSVAVLLIGMGVGIELLSQIPYSVFVGNERMGYVATSLVAQRLFTAVVGIVALFAGANLIETSVIFVAGSLVGLTSAIVWMRTRVVKPRWSVRWQRWWPIVRKALPLGVVAFIYTILLKLDITLLSLLTGGSADNSEVGQYGAAFRLIEATMFIGWSFGSAAMPWLSRDPGADGIDLARGYGLGSKALLAVLVPVGCLYFLLAEPLIDMLYGPQYEPAIELMQILSPMAILFGWNSFVATLLIARNVPAGFNKPAVAVLIQNVAFNLVLIPALGAEGAAISSVSSGVFLALLTIVPVRRAVGRVGFVSVIIAPLLAGICLTGATLAVGVDHLIASAAAGLLAFALAFLAVERVFFEDDFSIYRSLVARIRSRGRRPEEHVPPGSEMGI